MIAGTFLRKHLRYFADFHHFKVAQTLTVINSRRPFFSWIISVAVRLRVSWRYTWNTICQCY